MSRSGERKMACGRFNLFMRAHIVAFRAGNHDVVIVELHGGCCWSAPPSKLQAACAGNAASRGGRYRVAERVDCSSQLLFSTPRRAHAAPPPPSYWRHGRPLGQDGVRSHRCCQRRRGCEASWRDDGTDYVGWQTQAVGKGVQDVLENKLTRMLGGRVYVAGSGRTDKGVHARAQVFHFEMPEGVAKAPHIAAALAESEEALAASIKSILTGAASGLPADVQVTDISVAPPGFHAIRALASGTCIRYMRVLARHLSHAIAGCSARIKSLISTR